MAWLLFALATWRISIAWGEERRVAQWPAAGLDIYRIERGLRWDHSDISPKWLDARFRSLRHEIPHTKFVCNRVSDSSNRQTVHQNEKFTLRCLLYETLSPYDHILRRCSFKAIRTRSSLTQSTESFNEETRTQSPSAY